MALVVPHRLARAQVAQDTLAERVADQAFDAIDRCDRARFYSFFAPVWYHSVLEDSSGAATRHTREEALRKVDPNSWWAACAETSQGRHPVTRSRPFTGSFLDRT